MKASDILPILVFGVADVFDACCTFPARVVVAFCRTREEDVPTSLFWALNAWFDETSKENWSLKKFSSSKKDLSAVNISFVLIRKSARLCLEDLNVNVFSKNKNSREIQNWVITFAYRCISYFKVHNLTDHRDGRIDLFFRLEPNHKLASRLSHPIQKPAKFLCNRSVALRRIPNSWLNFESRRGKITFSS